jgi:hypothetical protein
MGGRIAAWPAAAVLALLAFAAEAASPSSAQELLDRARSLYDALDYDKVVPLAEQIINRHDATEQQRLDAQLLEGSCLAIIGDPIAAEKPFRALLRARPSFDLPPKTAPRILTVFRKVQVEERVIREQEEQAKLEQVRKGIGLSGVPPAAARGGEVIGFEYRLEDPTQAVAELSLKYRRAGQASYSSLALQRLPSGAWRAELPPEWTSSPDGFTLQYYLSTADKSGRELVSQGAPNAPLALLVEAGEAHASGPIYASVWFWVGVALVAGAGGGAAYLLARPSAQFPPTDLGVVSFHPPAK